MRAYRGLVVGTVVVVVGCRQILGIDDPSHQPPDNTDAPTCFGADFADGGLIKVCLQPTLGSIVVTGDIDTDHDPRCATVTPPVGPDVCVIEGIDITVSGPVGVGGHRPLVMIAAHSIDIAAGAMLDASSKLGGRVGAAANDDACAPTISVGGTGVGGAGGSFGGVGGQGGDATGRAQNPVMIQFVRGGCQGQIGTGAGQLAMSGPSGGALYLIAGDNIQVDGAILSSGGGGKGASGSAGGAGGGAGGLVGLDAPTIAGSGTIIAAGGGGGEGGNGSPGSASADGQDATGKFGMVAKGGSSQPDGGNGGNGGGFGIAATDGGSGSGSGGLLGGGGGGGGGVGIIWVRGTLTVTDVSPPKTP